MTTEPGQHNFLLPQGATFTEVLTWQDENGAAINLTGYTARMEAKRRQSPTTTVINLTTENGGIALGGSAGTITLTLNATATALLIPGTYDYDLELISSGAIVTRLLQGIVNVTPEVTT